MCLAAYLSQSRHGVFYFRWPIPQRLHPARKRSHVRLSLRTRCPATARRLSRVLVLTGQPTIEAASAQAMRYADIRQHVLDHFRGMLERFKDGVDDSGPIGPVRYAALETTQGLAGSGLDTWAGLIHPEGPDGLVQALCAQRGIPAADLSAQHRAWLLDALRKGHHAFAKAALGHVGALERFDLDMPPGSAAGADAAADDDAASAQPPLSYQEVVAQYFNEIARTGGIAAKTDADKRAALNLLAEITGDKPVAAITKADAQQAKQVLMQYPANRQKNRITRGKPPRSPTRNLGV